MTRRIGILVTGEPPQPLQDEFNSYDEMFRRLLGGPYAFAGFDVRLGKFPGGGQACDAYIITGSAAGVYDSHSWIRDLKGFIQGICGRAALIGVCFGHQLMAETFGGKVIKSPKGWGIGLHTYQVRKRAAWMDDAPSIAIPVSHQDQVVELPANAQVLAGNPFTPYGVLGYPDRRAISFQCHPEFTLSYSRALISFRRGSFTPALADHATESLRQPNDRELVASWIRRFLA
jgi:GMP synthase-like glutamine amidotransferase